MAQSNRKAQLIAEIERSRADLAVNLRGVRSDISVGSRIKRGFSKQKTVWLAGAAVAGWLLTRIPARKKAAAPAVSEVASKHTKENERKGIALALLSVAVTLLKPAATAFAQKKIAEFTAEGAFAGQSRGAGRKVGAR